MTTKPRKYQLEGVERIERFQGRALLADDMGLGKSFQALLYAQRNKLAPIVIVCPASLKWNWEREAAKHVRMRSEILEGTKVPRAKWRLTKPKVVIVNYDILTHWVKAIKRLKPQLVIVDECFPFETPILTDQGVFPIGQIVETKMNAKVLSFDISTNSFCYKPIVHYIKTLQRERLVTVHHSLGTLTCTENHEIWTSNQGYVKAKNLSNKNCLRMVRENTSIANSQSVLQQDLLGQMESTSAELDKSVPIKRTQSKNQSSQERETSSRHVLANEKEQPIMESQSNSQNKTNQTQERNIECLDWDSRRQRNVFQTSNEVVAGIGKTSLENGVCNTDETENPIPTLLQSGHSPSSIENSNRGGWDGASSSIETSSGQKERSIVTDSWVDRVEVHERNDTQQSKNSNGKNYVYCLEVDSTHNFFANGILVHNCQYIKSRSAKRTLAVKRLCKRVQHVVCLSGTPMTNRPVELWPTVNLLVPKHFNSFPEFGHRYCKPEWTRWGWQYKGASHLDELHDLLNLTCMIRRLKSDVLQELPAKQRIVLPMPIKQRSEYDYALADFASWLRQKHPSTSARALKAEELAKAGYLKRLIAELKLPGVIEWVENFLQDSDGKLILFAIHTKIIRELYAKFQTVATYIDGSVTGKKRQIAIDQFQHDPKTRIMIGQLQAAGVGWNGTAAESVAFAELGWTPGEHSQAEDRAHRLGQKGSVACYYLVGRDTIEDRLCKILRDKQKVLTQTLDGKSGGDSSSVFDELIRDIKKGGK